MHSLVRGFAEGVVLVAFEDQHVPLRESLDPIPEVVIFRPNLRLDQIHRLILTSLLRDDSWRAVDFVEAILHHGLLQFNRPAIKDPRLGRNDSKGVRLAQLFDHCEGPAD